MAGLCYTSCVSLDKKSSTFLNLFPHLKMVTKKPTSELSGESDQGMQNTAGS